MDKLGLLRLLGRMVNPFVIPLAGHIPGWVVLETIGRKSGKQIRVPIGDGLDGKIFWIISEHGENSDYVKNLIANPRVRILRRGKWLSGTAVVLPDDDPVKRQKSISNPINKLVVRALATDMLSIRVDLD